MKRVRYLLGLSSRAERELIESEYFEDDDAFQEMLAAEDDLIDSYARGELTDEERRSFERNFANSLRGRDRVQFARAFAGEVSATQLVETKFLLDTSKILQSPRLLTTARIAVVIVFVVMLAWLVNDRRRMTNELRELRAVSAEFSKQTEALKRSNDTERTRMVEMAAQLGDLRRQPDNPRHPGRGTTESQRARHLPKATNEREKIATVGNTFERKRITELPIEGRSVPSLSTLQPTTIRGGYIAGGRADQANATLDGVPAENLKTGSLISRNTISTGETTIRIPSLHKWIRFQIPLGTPAIHEDYSVTIKTTDGRLVTSVDWIEPLTPNQTLIDTPAISTSDLPSGDYVLLLMGKRSDGLFVKVAEYSFRVIRY